MFQRLASFWSTRNLYLGRVQREAKHTSLPSVSCGMVPGVKTASSGELHLAAVKDIHTATTAQIGLHPSLHLAIVFILSVVVAEQQERVCPRRYQLLRCCMLSSKSESVHGAISYFVAACIKPGEAALTQVSLL